MLALVSLRGGGAGAGVCVPLLELFRRDLFGVVLGVESNAGFLGTGGAGLRPMLGSVEADDGLGGVFDVPYSTAVIISKALPDSPGCPLGESGSLRSLRRVGGAGAVGDFLSASPKPLVLAIMTQSGS